MVTPLYELTCDYVRMSGKVVLHIINQVCDPFKKNNIMRMNNIFKQILLCIALVSGMACSGLNSKSSNNNGKMDTAFIWRAFVASPKFYPMEVMYANVRLGNTDDVLIINLIYNLKISKQSYAKEILLLTLPMVRY